MAALSAWQRRYRENAQAREKERARCRTKAALDPDKRRAYQRKYKMGLSSAEFDAAWEACAGHCEICSCELATGGRGRRVACADHNHATRRFRGILCRGCNAALGLIGDSPRWLREATMYLQSR